MSFKPVMGVVVLTVGLLSQTSCIVGVGDWQRFSKDIHSSYPLKAGGTLNVETFNGSVDISGWDQDTVDISATKFGPSQEEADNLHVDIEATPSSVTIRVPRPGLLRNNQGARFVIKIPRGARLDRITTSNSSIHTQDGVGSTRLKTSNGSIRVLDLKGTLDADTSNSSVELSGVDGDARVHTSNGSIRINQLNGGLEASTSNSSVHMEAMRPDRPIRIDTSNGSVEVNLPEGFSSPVRVDTSNSPITVRVYDGTNARIAARTSNSSIHTEFAVRAEGDISKNRLDAEMGKGGPLIDLSTSNGSIKLLRR